MKIKLEGATKCQHLKNMLRTVVSRMFEDVQRLPTGLRNQFTGYSYHLLMYHSPLLRRSTLLSPYRLVSVAHDTCS